MKRLISLIKSSFFRRPETRIVLVMGVALLSISNYFISDGIKSREAQRFNDMSIQSVLNRQLVDENMKLMFQSIYLQRAWIEERFRQKGAVSSYSWLTEELSYNQQANLSTLDHIEPQEEKAFGNIIVKGNIKHMSPETRAEMESLSELFDMQRFIKNDGIRNSWSTYFSPAYILIYPFKEGIATMNEEDAFFGIVEASLLELNKPENGSMYEAGWDVGIDFDITGTVLMFAKYLPVKKGDTVVGAICDNIAVEDVESIITPIENIGMYLVDSAGSVIYDNGEHISSIMKYQDVLMKRHQFNANMDLMEARNGIKNNGFYYFISSVENADWKFIYVVPESLIEIKPEDKLFIAYTTNGVIILGILFILWLLLRYHNKALEIDRQKDQFLMNISHDLKSPLNSILGFNRMLEDKFRESILPELDLNNQQTGKVVSSILRNTAIVQKEGQRLNGLINNLLDISVLEHTDQSFRYQPCEVEPLLRESCEAVQGAAAEKGLELRVEVEAGLDGVLADRERIMQVLNNLLSNGIKFTDSGFVECSAERKGDVVLFCIEDTGIGIPKEDSERIFNRFVRSKKSMLHREGTGLGLSICRSILEKHCGKIWVESKDQQGSRFYFTLPLAKKEGVHGEA